MNSFRFFLGKFVSRLISPRKAELGLGKVYEVTLQKNMTGKEKEMFESGEMLLRYVVNVNQARSSLIVFLGAKINLANLRK